MGNDANDWRGSPLPELISMDELGSLLDEWQHPHGERWLAEKVKAEELVFEGEPPSVGGEAVWRRLLQDECSKLYNQAWCAYEHIKEAKDPDSVAMLAMDDLPRLRLSWAVDVAPAAA